MHFELGESRSFLPSKAVAKDPERAYMSGGSADARNATDLMCHGLDWELEAWFGYYRPPACDR